MATEVVEGRRLRLDFDVGLSRKGLLNPDGKRPNTAPPGGPTPMPATQS